MSTGAFLSAFTGSGGLTANSSATSGGPFQTGEMNVALPAGALDQPSAFSGSSAGGLSPLVIGGLAAGAFALFLIARK